MHPKTKLLSKLLIITLLFMGLLSLSACSKPKKPFVVVASANSTSNTDDIKNKSGVAKHYYVDGNGNLKIAHKNGTPVSKHYFANKYVIGGMHKWVVITWGLYLLFIVVMFIINTATFAKVSSEEDKMRAVQKLKYTMIAAILLGCTALVVGVAVTFV